jgi:hypothetical protein
MDKWMGGTVLNKWEVNTNLGQTTQGTNGKEGREGKAGVLGSVCVAAS